MQFIALLTYRLLFQKKRNYEDKGGLESEPCLLSPRNFYFFNSPFPEIFTQDPQRMAEKSEFL